MRAVLAACAGAALMPAVTLAQPVNNTCAGIITVATPSSTTATNVGATGTNLTSCAGAGDINDVWFRFVAPSNAGYQFDTEGTVGMDTTLGLFSACESGELACDDDGGTGFLSLLQYTLTSGQEIFIRVAGWNGAQNTFRLNVAGGTPPPPPPANDLCEGAASLATLPLVINVDSQGATPDLDTSCNDAGAFETNNGSWYKINPAVNTQLVVTESSGLDVVITLFSGDCNSLSEVSCVNANDAAVFSLSAGTTYRILVGIFSATPIVLPPGTISLSFAEVLPPANDTCAAATLITTLPANATVEVLGATEDIDTSCNDAGAFATNNGIWYRYTPAADTRIRIAESGALDAVITLFSGSCNALSEVACISNAADTASFNLSGGQTYYILVGIFGATPAAVPPAAFILTFTELPPFINDECSGAFAVAPNSSTLGDNLAAGGTDITTCAAQDTFDVWYKLTTAEAGTFQFDTEGTVGLDTTLALFDACGGTELACDDDGGTGLLSLLVRNLSAGEQIFIRVAGWNNNVGNYVLNVSGGPPPPAPANDLCQNAQAIPAMPFNTQVTAGGATGDVDVACNNAADFETAFGVWYTFTPAETGTIVMNETGANDVVFAIFSGGCAGSEIFCSTAEPSPAFQLQAGTQHHILVGQANSANVPLAQFNLAFTYTPAPGACCIGNTCTIVSGAAACTAISGTWQGAGVDCGGTPANTNTTQVAIPDYSGGPTVVSSDFTVTDAVPVTSVKVFVGLTHTFVGDLTIRLRAPNGAVADLAVRAGSAACVDVDGSQGDDINGLFVFDDNASLTLNDAAIANAAAVLPPGTFRPAGCANAPSSLATTFAGIMANGVWSVDVSDHAGLDIGTIDSFGVVVNNLGTPTPCSGAVASGACCNQTQCSVLAAAACTGPGTRFSGANTVCNVQGNNLSPCCRADFNQNGTILLQDLFDYLTAFFAQSPSAQFDQFPGVALEDLFAFLNAWFTPC